MLGEGGEERRLSCTRLGNARWGAEIEKWIDCAEQAGTWF